MKRLYKEPFLIFLSIGLCLFLYELRGIQPKSSELAFQLVEQSLVENYVSQYGQEPSVLEKEQLKEQWLNDEALYQSALNLSLDLGDEIVRRRLVQKMYLLLEAAYMPEALSSSEVEDYFNSNKNQYRTANKYTFEVIEISRRHFKGEADKVAIHLLNDLSLGHETLDSIASLEGFLIKQYKNSSDQEILRNYDSNFLNHVSQSSDANTFNSWQGLINTAKGGVLYRLLSETQGSVASFENIYQSVEKDLQAEKKQQYLTRKIAEIRGDYFD